MATNEETTQRRIKPALTTDHVEAFLGSRHGRVESLTPLLDGHVSQAFSFDAAGAGFVVRFAASAEAYRRDEFAGRTIARDGVPIPPILRSRGRRLLVCALAPRDGGQPQVDA